MPVYRSVAGVLIFVVDHPISATGWYQPPRLLRSHPSEGGELELRYVTYYVSRIYKERINAFPTEIECSLSILGGDADLS